MTAISIAQNFQIAKKNLIILHNATYTNHLRVFCRSHRL